MTYAKTNWINEVPQSTPVKYRIKLNDGSYLENVEIETVTPITAGTPLNSTNLNKIEQALEDIHADGGVSQEHLATSASKVYQWKGYTMSGGQPVVIPELLEHCSIQIGRQAVTFPAGQSYAHAEIGHADFLTTFTPDFLHMILTVNNKESWSTQSPAYGVRRTVTVNQLFYPGSEKTFLYLTVDNPWSVDHIVEVNWILFVGA